MTEYSIAPGETLAVIAGKLSARAIRVMGLGLASNLPGKISRKIASSILGHLAGQSRRGVLAVSGTNGKSTTSGLVASILSQAGMKLVHNRQGANLATGITACVVDASSWSGHLDADFCLFEIDEAALPVVAKEMRIDHVLVTNLFRDQLDRFGELDTTARLISKGITQNKSSSVLNADDPNVAQMVPDCSRLFYGVESLAAVEQTCNSQPLGSSLDAGGTPASPGLEGAGTETARTVAAATMASADNTELSYCSACGEEFKYDIRFYGQLGHYKCPSCGNKRPSPDVIAEQVQVKSGSSRFVLRYAEHRLDIDLNLPGMFNVYNALAAAALCFKLGIPADTIKAGLCDYSTLFGRSEKIKLNDKHILIQLIKNPAGASQAVQAAAADPSAKYLIAINDNYADGRDVSCSGTRILSSLQIAGDHLL